MTASFLRFLDYTQWNATVGRTPSDEGSDYRRDLYLTTHTKLRHPWPGRNFFKILVLSLYLLYPYLFLCPNCPGFAFGPLLYDTHNASIHAPGGIRTRNASKRSAADSCLRRLGHWERLLCLACFMFIHTEIKRWNAKSLKFWEEDLHCECRVCEVSLSLRHDA